MPALDRPKRRLWPARQARPVRAGSAGRPSGTPHRTASPGVGQTDRRKGPPLRNRLSLVALPLRRRDLDTWGTRAQSPFAPALESTIDSRRVCSTAAGRSPTRGVEDEGRSLQGRRTRVAGGDGEGGTAGSGAI